MKKIILFTTAFFLLFNLKAYASTAKEISDKDLIDIYIVALESFIPKEGAINISKKDYLAIDMSSPILKSVPEEGKDKILNHFKKYGLEVMNESVDTLIKKGLANKYGDLIYNGKSGILLGIQGSYHKSDSEVIIKGYWQTSGVAARGARSTILLKNGEWKLEKRVWTWMS